jgi:hypothetical protein
MSYSTKMAAAIFPPSRIAALVHFAPAEADPHLAGAVEIAGH